MKKYLLLILPFFLFILSNYIRDANQIITASQANFNKLTGYEINSTIVVSVSLSGMKIKSVSNITTIKEGNNTYSIIYSPFTGITKNFIEDESIIKNPTIHFIYGGSRKVGKYDCDIIYADSDKEMPLIDNLSEIKHFASYYCIEPHTGIIIESFWSIYGKYRINDSLVDTEINITKYVNNFVIKGA